MHLNDNEWEGVESGRLRPKIVKYPFPVPNNYKPDFSQRMAPTKTCYECPTGAERPSYY